MSERLASEHSGSGQFESERLDAFMARANALYYATRDPFADFTTAPEIAQMFGELLGAWAAVVWDLLGAPDPVLLVEAGPGRGTLMQDALRTTAGVAAGFRAACRVHLIETSPRLRAEQAARIPDAVWHDDFATVPPGPAIVLANEFLDALPIRQFVRRAAGWMERRVEAGQFVEEPCAALDDAARPGVSPGCGGWARAPAEADAQVGDIVEVGEPGLAWVSRLGQRLAGEGGAALILDYGTARSGPGDTLQALRDGRPANPLADPGSADLTAHVDFAALRQAAEAAGATAWGPVAQGRFLASLGLQARTGRLAAANPHRASALREAADRLSAPSRMGTLFKALCVTQPGAPCPPGFA